MDMDFTQAVPIVIAGLLASSMVDARMLLSPVVPASRHAVLIRIHMCPWNNGVFDARRDGRLRHIGQQIDHDLTIPRHHAKDGWPLLLQGASATFSLEAASTALASLVLHHLRRAFMAGNHIRFIALHCV